MDVCVGVSVLWVAGGIISGIFEAAPECQEDLPLSILTRRPHKDLCPHEPARPEVKRRDVGQLGAKLRSKASDIQSSGCGARQFGPGARDCSVGSKTWV